MFIIFGWGKQLIKRFGVTFQHSCDHCHNEDYWTLSRITTWFTFFFIPVIPYSVKYFLSCPVCQYGFTLDKEQFNSIKPLAELNQSLIDGEITEKDYQISLAEFNNDNSVDAKAEESKMLEEGDSKLVYCPNCGGSLEKGDKFCSSCGKETKPKTTKKGK